jgi:hypothetical protein
MLYNDSKLNIAQTEDEVIYLHRTATLTCKVNLPLLTSENLQSLYMIHSTQSTQEK